MAKTRKYYTLAVFEPGRDGGSWGPQFGDYDREVVAQELEDTRDDWDRGCKFKIITTGDKARDIDEAIAALNHHRTAEVVS